jgi:hypothetical protein
MFSPASAEPLTIRFTCGGIQALRRAGCGWFCMGPDPSSLLGQAAYTNARLFASRRGDARGIAACTS